MSSTIASPPNSTRTRVLIIVGIVLFAFALGMAAHVLSRVAPGVPGGSASSAQLFLPVGPALVYVLEAL